ncbi:ketopantoate reductase family protein [Bordetella sp. LUAb4]|uniref:ketopantoate reductase family protein n=1 Tax=Bordetella sp. LUAb4 TaxID=2843195 RepID=UPI001E5B2BBC|nr:2-dehydropantoate 2-reductase [Bordetella sp. LUAb4]
MKKICIFGAGSVGGHMAARLAQAGLDVSVVVRGAHLAAIREHGLRLTAPDADFTVRVQASDNPADLGPQDLVISTLKAQSLGAAAAGLATLLKPDTPVVFAVNGIPWWYFHGLPDDGSGQPAATRLPRLDPEGLVWRHIGARRALGCVIRSPNELSAPGVVHSTSTTNTYTIGEPDNSASPRLAEIVATLRHGLPGARASQQIRRDIWAKLVLNVPSSLTCALTVSTAPELFAQEDTRELWRQLGNEANAVAAAHGIDAGFDLDAQISSGGKNRHPPSMLQDLLAGRPLELDAQMRAVQDLGRMAGVATPMLDVAVTLLAQRARSEFAASLRAKA